MTIAVLPLFNNTLFKTETLSIGLLFLSQTYSTKVGKVIIKIELNLDHLGTLKMFCNTVMQSD